MGFDRNIHALDPRAAPSYESLTLPPQIVFFVYLFRMNSLEKIYIISCFIFFQSCAGKKSARLLVRNTTKKHSVLVFLRHSYLHLEDFLGNGFAAETLLVYLHFQGRF